MINNQLTLLRDIKTVDQLIIKLVQLGYQRANDFEEEDNEWGEINKYCVVRDEELAFPNTPRGSITINPKTWLNNENNRYAVGFKDDPFVDFSTHVLFDNAENLYEWSICYVEMGELWDIDIDSVYIEKLDLNLIEFIDVADEKLDKRIKQRCEEKVRRLGE